MKCSKCHKSIPVHLISGICDACWTEWKRLQDYIWALWLKGEYLPVPERDAK